MSQICDVILFSIWKTQVPYRLKNCYWPKVNLRSFEWESIQTRARNSLLIAPNNPTHDVFMVNSVQHCGEHWLVWGIPVAAVAHSLKSWNRQYQAIPCNTTPYNTKPVKFRAPVKELEWTNMGLGFLRTTRRASETQILENWSLWTDRLSLWNMWTGHVSRVKYLQTSCYPMSIYEGACEFVKIFYVIINIV